MFHTCFHKRASVSCKKVSDRLMAKIEYYCKLTSGESILL